MRIKGCCRDWMDEDEEVRKKVMMTEDSIREFSRDEVFKREFEEDVQAFLFVLIATRETIEIAEKRYYEYLEIRDEISIEEASFRLYELNELKSHLDERIEDLGYYEEKMMDLDWEEMVREEEDEMVLEKKKELARLGKEMFRILIRMIYVRYYFLVKNMEILHKLLELRKVKEGKF